jgi:hypothetical protein
VKAFAGVWIASLPKEMEGKRILGVEFLSPKVIDMKIWKPTFSLARYTPESLVFKGRISESVMEDFHLARMQVEIQDTSMDKLIEVAKEVIYPHIRRAALIVDIASATGHIYVSSEVIFGLRNIFSTWVGVSAGRPQGELKKDLLELMEKILSTGNDRSFVQRIERALLTWGDAQEEPERDLKIAKLWTALEALLRREPEPVWKTVSRRSIALAMMESRESIDLFSIAGWRISFNETSLYTELEKFLKDTYDVRNLVYHQAEGRAQRIGFALELSSLTQVLILKMAEFAQKGYSWEEVVTNIDQRAREL